jgi:hypothetical protein
MSFYQNSNNEFKKKYLKYKEKYIKLKNNIARLNQKGGDGLVLLNRINLGNTFANTCALSEQYYFYSIPNNIFIRTFDGTNLHNYFTIFEPGDIAEISVYDNSLLVVSGGDVNCYNTNGELQFTVHFPNNFYLKSAKKYNEYIICLGNNQQQIKILRWDNRELVREFNLVHNEHALCIQVINYEIFILYPYHIQKYNLEGVLQRTIETQTNTTGALQFTVIQNKLFILPNISLQVGHGDNAIIFEPFINISVYDSNLEFERVLNTGLESSPVNISSYNNRLLISGEELNGNYLYEFEYQNEAVPEMPAPISSEEIQKIFIDINQRLSNPLLFLGFQVETAPRIELYFIETVSTNGVTERSFSYTRENIIRDANGQILSQNIEVQNIFTQLFRYQNDLSINNPKPFFIFRNLITNVRDAGIDAGGLTKTVFLRLSDFLNSSYPNPYLVKDNDTEYYKFRPMLRTELDSNNNRQKIKFLGTLFGIIIKQKQQIFIDLDPFLLYQMVNDDFFSLNSTQIQKILRDFDTNIFNHNPYRCFDEQRWQADPSCQYIEDADGNLVEYDIANRFTETVNKIKEPFTQALEVTNLFVSGFRESLSLPIYHLLARKPVRVLDMFIVGNRNLTLEILLTTIRFEGFTEEQKNYMKEIISENYRANDSSEIYLTKLLELITGTARIPASGYPAPHYLRIRLSDTQIVPFEIHSCYNYLDINEDRFVESFSSGIGNIRNTNLYQDFSLESINTILGAGFTIV